MNEELNRKLPFSLLAEQSLLGGILVDPESINEVADIIKADDFYITEHKQIYLAATELFMTNREIDVVTLIDTLVQKGIYDKSGGEDYIKTIAEVVPTSLNLKDYAKIVKEKSALRQLIEVCSEDGTLFGAGGDGGGEEEALVQLAHQAEVGAHLLTQAGGGEPVGAAVDALAGAGDVAAGGGQTAAGILDQAAHNHIGTHVAGLNGFHKLAVAVIYHDDNILAHRFCNLCNAAFVATSAFKFGC